MRRTKKATKKRRTRAILIEFAEIYSALQKETYSFNYNVKWIDLIIYYRSILLYRTSSWGGLFSHEKRVRIRLHRYLRT
jgi:hypothetical protein